MGFGVVPSVQSPIHESVHLFSYPFVPATFPLVSGTVLSAGNTELTDGVRVFLELIVKSRIELQVR